MPADRPSLPAVDYIKSAAILAVLVQHTIPVIFERPWTPTETTINAMISFHVPTFLFVAGFLSHAETAVPLRGVAARLQRILPPYLVATAVAWMLGHTDVTTLRRAIFTTVTGSAFGHYYFVPALILCVLLLPVFSRLRTPVVIGATVLLLLVCEYMWLLPEWRVDFPLFWQVRHPILQFHLGFFLLGVIAARVRPMLERVRADHRVAIVVVAGAVVAVFAALTRVTDAVFHPAPRAAYMLAVMAALAAAVPRTPAPRSVRFLSDATFTVYLYHWFAYMYAMRLLSPTTPLALRILVLVAAGLVFSTFVVLCGRRVLGSRSRLLLGT